MSTHFLQRYESREDYCCWFWHCPTERSGAGNRERINVQGRLLLLVSALSHGAERSGEQRKNKCPGKTTAVGFGIVPLPPANKPAFTVYTFVFLSYQRFPVLFLQVCPASKDFLSFVVFCTSWPVECIDLKRITRCKLASIFTSADHRKFLGLFGAMFGSEAARL
jgi:hypothetical protein